MSPSTRPRIALAALALLPLIGWGCTPTAAVVAPAPEAAAGPPAWTADALTPDLFAIDSRGAGTPGRGTILLVGENHASSRSQIDLNTILVKLRQAGKLDAILVEGSSGPIDIREFSGAFKADLAGRDADAYWREQLEWGRVAGYEAFALTHPDVPVLGVEDMAAKKRHEISLTRDGIRRVRERNDRAAALAEKAIADLAAAPGGEVAGLDDRLGRYREAVRGQGRASQEFDEGLKPALEREVETATLIQELTGQVKALQPVLDQLQELQKQTDAYNATVASIKRDAGGDPARIRPADPRIAQLQQMKPRIEALEKQIEPHMAELERLGQLNRRLEELAKAGREDQERLKALTDRLREADRAVQDEYFLLSNAIAKAARGRGRSFPELQAFFRDEHRRAEREERENATPPSEEQRARDKAMVANTIAHLQQKGPLSVVLVVGAHHLKNVAALLEAEGLPFVGGHLTANDRQLQPWELAAWTRRRHAQERLYSWDEGGVLPETRLQNPLWKDEQTARLEAFRKVERPGTDGPAPAVRGLIHDGVVYENILPRSDLALHISRFMPDRNADFGEHVVDFGPDPAAPGRYFMTYDREKARGLVKELSREGTAFSYYYKTLADGKAAYRVESPSGQASLDAFKDAPPGTSDGSPTARVVLFGEPDVILEGNAVAVEPLWRSLLGLDREPSAGGGGDGNDLGGGEKVAAAPEPGRHNLRDRLRKDGKDGEAGETRADGGGSKKPPSDTDGTASSGRGRDDGPGPEGRGRGWSRLLLGGEGEGRPSVYRTTNPRRAEENLRVLSRQKAEYLGEITYLEAGQLDQLPFTPSRGDNAQVVVIVARNVEEFRAEVARAAEAQTLENKQVALVTCGGAFPETAQLREALLQSGSLIVWTPDRQVTPEAAGRLKEYIRKVEQSSASGERPTTIDQVVRKALQLWYRDDPSDPSLQNFLRSSTWVRRESNDEGRGDV